MSKIYFNSDTDPFFSAGASCLVYDENTGVLKIVSDRKEVKVFTNTDNEQTAIINDLSDQINTLKKSIKGLKINFENSGVLTNDTEVVFSSPSLKTTDLNTKSNSNKVLQIIDSSLSGVTPVQLKGKSIDIDGLNYNTTNSNAVINFNTSGDITVNNVDVSSTTKFGGNVFNVHLSKNIYISDTNFKTNGYNAIMIGQENLSELPEKIVIENVEFADMDLGVINICATANNAEVLIKNCKFGKCQAPLRLRNVTNASGVKIKFENCTFTDPGVGYEHFLILCEEYFDGQFGDTNGGTRIDTLVTSNVSGSFDGEYTYKDIFPYLLEFEDNKNRFGSDKIEIEFVACKQIINGVEENLVIDTNRFGTNEPGEKNNTDLVYILRLSGRKSNNDSWNDLFDSPSGEFAGRVDISYPYSPEQSYFADVDWTSQLKEAGAPNSARYPKITCRD
jgi:hypothetical protein